VVLVIMIGAWVGFLFLVKTMSINTTPALIMSWVSVLFVILAISPSLLARVTRVKLKDFEIELRGTIAISFKEEMLSFVDSEVYNQFEKGSFHKLIENLERARQDPSKPDLLVTNLGSDREISTKMLFVYLYYLDQVSSSVRVLFIEAATHVINLSEISKDSIVGVVNGKKILQSFYKRFPQFSRAIQSTRGPTFSWAERRAEEWYRLHYEQLSAISHDENLQYSQFLSVEDVKNWFRGELCSRTFDATLNQPDFKIVQDAILAGDEFIICLKDSKIRSVVSLNGLTRAISKRVIGELYESS